eukprot:4924504-Amphidinium_carterae.1
MLTGLSVSFLWPLHVSAPCALRCSTLSLIQKWSGTKARGLVRALDEPGIDSTMVIARIYVISDVLYNTSADAYTS